MKSANQMIIFLVSGFPNVSNKGFFFSGRLLGSSPNTGATKWIDQLYKGSEFLKKLWYRVGGRI